MISANIDSLTKVIFDNMTEQKSKSVTDDELESINSEVLANLETSTYNSSKNTLSVAKKKSNNDKWFKPIVP